MPRRSERQRTEAPREVLIRIALDETGEAATVRVIEQQPPIEPFDEYHSNPNQVED